MTRGQRKAELVAIVADLLALRYCHADIGRVVGRTPQRIGQITQNAMTTNTYATTVPAMFAGHPASPSPRQVGGLVPPIFTRRAGQSAGQSAQIDTAGRP